MLGIVVLAATVPVAVWMRLFYEDWRMPIGHEANIERGQEIIRQTLVAGIIWFSLGCVVIHLAVQPTPLIG